MSELTFRQVHLDFHTSEKIDEVGRDFDKKKFQQALKTGHISSITVFGKCHHGWAYFPSEKNEMHPTLKINLLQKQLEACAEIGVEAPVYISAGFDEKYIRRHPEYLHVWHYGDDKYTFEEPRYNLICMNTPYLKYLEEQVKEIVETFMPVGIFLDIVAPRPCYCKACCEARKTEGHDPADEKWAIEYGERTYKKYYETINNAAKSIKPDIRIFHNGGHIAPGKRDIAFANTHLELESLPTGGWGYDHFPMSAKYVHHLGMEYLGMTGKFHKSWGEFGGFKHPNALKYEAALSIAHGAKCSIGDQMHPYAFMEEATYELIGEAYSYIEDKEEYCTDAKPVAEIGVLSLENAGNLDKNLPCDAGVGRILLESHYLFDVLDFECDFSKYRLIILPDAFRVNQEQKAVLDKYLSNGGKLLCSGLSGVWADKDEFAFDFGADFVGKSEFQPTYCRPVNDIDSLKSAPYLQYNAAYDIKNVRDCEIFAYRQNSFFNRTKDHFCSHYHTPNTTKDDIPSVIIGKDGAYVGYNIFEEYAEVGSITQKEMVRAIIDKLLEGKPLVKTSLPAQGVITLNRQTEENRYVCHLLYAAPVRRGKEVDIIEDLLPIYNTKVALRLPEEIKRVYLAPEKKEIVCNVENDVVEFEVDEFTCHQMIVLEY